MARISLLLLLIVLLASACGGMAAAPDGASPTAASGMLNATELAAILPTERPTAPVPEPPSAGTGIAVLTRADGLVSGLLAPRVVLYHDEFDSNDTTLFLGRTEYGSRAFISEGAYWLEVQDDGWQNVTLTELTDLANGVVMTDATLAGDGAVGVVARSSTDSGGSFWFYVCWVNSRGEAGCHTSVQSQWTELWYAEPGVVQLATTNHLALAGVGPDLTFEVNGRVVTRLTDATTTSGMWGVFVESYHGAVTAAFESLTIGEIGE